MNLTTDIELYSASDIEIDASVIDVSEVDTEVEKEFLREQGARILTVTAKADFAIKKIVATIQGRASLEKGKIIAEVQDRFYSEDERGTGLNKWYKSVGLTAGCASNYARAYRATKEFQGLFDGIVEPEKVLKCSDSTLAKIQTLPEEYRHEKLAEIAVGNIPKRSDIEHLQDKSEVKLSKAQELLAAAKERMAKADKRWEEVKADPELKPGTSEYKAAESDKANAVRAVDNFQQQIATLKTQVEEEKLKAAEAEKREAATKAELQKLKFDDAKSRAERVKRLTSSLTVGVPQALADLQKFFAEKDHYPEDVRKHVLEQATQLANYIGDQL